VKNVENEEFRMRNELVSRKDDAKKKRNDHKDLELTRNQP
jgi:hypothetical protein